LNRVLRQQLGKRRLRLTDDQRARLAARAVAFGRSVLESIATIVTPDTPAAVAPAPGRREVDASGHRSPRTSAGPAADPRPHSAHGEGQSGLGLFAHRRRPANVGHDVARTTVANFLKRAGIAPVPERATSWRTFLRTHAGSIAAADFFTVEVWTARGLVTHYVLFVIDIATRAVSIAGVTTNPDSGFMAQVARNLTDQIDGLVRGKRFLIVDRDSTFDSHFGQILKNAGARLVKTARRAPNMNTFAARFVRTIQDECLSRIVFFGEAMLRRALTEFLAHYHAERNHEGVENRLLMPEVGPAPEGNEVVRLERLGGLLSFYERRHRRRAG
jgi:putative transposase